MLNVEENADYLHTEWLESLTEGEIETRHFLLDRKGVAGALHWFDFPHGPEYNDISGRLDPETGTFSVPARTAAVFVQLRPVAEQIELLIADIDRLEADGVLGPGIANALRWILDRALAKLGQGKPHVAAHLLDAFVYVVDALERFGKLSAE